MQGMIRDDQFALLDRARTIMHSLVLPPQSRTVVMPGADHFPPRWGCPPDRLASCNAQTAMGFDPRHAQMHMGVDHTGKTIFRPSTTCLRRVDEDKCAESVIFNQMSARLQCGQATLAVLYQNLQFAISFCTIFKEAAKGFRFMSKIKAKTMPT
jgi:hypothetical protein